MEPQWPLIFFTLFVTLGAGTLGAVSLSALSGSSKSIQKPGLIVGLASLVIGGFFSLLHLQTPTNYFNQLGNFASGINQEIVMLGVCVVLMAISFVLLRRGGEDAEPNKVLAVISLIASVLLVIVMSHSYMMPSIPAWDTVLLPLFYLLNAAVFGALVLTVLNGLFAKETSNSKASLVALVSLAGFAVVIFAFVAFFGGAEYASRLWWDAAAGPADSTGAATAIAAADPSVISRSIFAGDLAGIFWGAVVVVGLALPAMASIVAWKQRGNGTIAARFSAAAIIAVMVGGVFFRVLLYMSGAHYFAY